MVKKPIIFTVMQAGLGLKCGDKFTIQGVYEMTRWGAAKRRALNTWRRFYWPVKDYLRNLWNALLGRTDESDYD